MTKRTFGKRSKLALENVHPQLVKLAERALELCDTDFSVLEGHRGEAEQNKAYRLGNTKVKYPNSAHNQMPALAIDCIPYPFAENGGWKNEAGFQAIAQAMFQAARELKLDIRWGGDFNRDENKTVSDAWDKPHFELHPWRQWRDHRPA